MVCSIIKTEGCMRGNGRKIRCMVRENFSTSQESLPTKDSGLTINFQDMDVCTTSIQNTFRRVLTTPTLMRFSKGGQNTKVCTW